MGGANMRQLVLLTLVALVLTGCALGEHPNCREIIELRSQVGGEYSVDDVVLWVSEAYQISPEKINILENKNKKSYEVQWKEGGVWYSISIEQDKVVRIIINSCRITANHLQMCLGKPRWYEAKYKRHWSGQQLSFDMLFTEQGVVAHGSTFLRSRPVQPPPIEGDYAITLINLVPPGSPEQVLAWVYGPGFPNAYSESLQGLKPWPGEWKDIQIEIDPD